MVLNTDTAPRSHEWAPCFGHEFPTYKAFESAMNKMAKNNFFVVLIRFRRASGESASSGHLPRVDAFCSRSNRGRL